jgi:hypothetical protein
MEGRGEGGRCRGWREEEGIEKCIGGVRGEMERGRWKEGG